MNKGHEGRPCPAVVIGAYAKTRDEPAVAHVSLKGGSTEDAVWECSPVTANRFDGPANPRSDVPTF